LPFSSADLDFQIDALLASEFRDNRHEMTDGTIGSFHTVLKTRWTEPFLFTDLMGLCPAVAHAPAEFQCLQ
jgi:hypothetical protein